MVQPWIIALPFHHHVLYGNNKKGGMKSKSLAHIFALSCQMEGETAAQPLVLCKFLCLSNHACTFVMKLMILYSTRLFQLSMGKTFLKSSTYQAFGLRLEQDWCCVEGKLPLLGDNKIWLGDSVCLRYLWFRGLLRYIGFWSLLEQIQVFDCTCAKALLALDGHHTKEAIPIKGDIFSFY